MSDDPTGHDSLYDKSGGGAAPLLASAPPPVYVPGPSGAFAPGAGAGLPAAFPPPPSYGYAGPGGMPPSAFQPQVLPTMPSAPMPRTPWQIYCETAEVKPEIQADLRTVLETTTIVLLLDDSGSMATGVRPPGSNPMAPAPTTRWAELQGDALSIVQLVTAVNPRGIDVRFMNRPGRNNVTDPSMLAPMFSNGPQGGTPMISSIRNVVSAYSGVRGDVLMILVTDGEPSDGEYSDLFRQLQYMPPNFYTSFVECNDNEEEMAYLSSWDTQLPRFHNQEDYPEELNLIRRVNGPQAKFTRANYVQMIVLSPKFPKYAIDVRVAGGKRNPFGGGWGGGGWGGGSGGGAGWGSGGGPEGRGWGGGAGGNGGNGGGCCPC